MQVGNIPTLYQNRNNNPFGFFRLQKFGANRSNFRKLVVSVAMSANWFFQQHFFRFYTFGFFWLWRFSVMKIGSLEKTTEKSISVLVSVLVQRWNNSVHYHLQVCLQLHSIFVIVAVPWLHLIAQLVPFRNSLPVWKSKYFFSTIISYASAKNLALPWYF